VCVCVLSVFLCVECVFVCVLSVCLGAVMCLCVCNYFVNIICYYFQYYMLCMVCCVFVCALCLWCVMFVVCCVVCEWCVCTQWLQSPVVPHHRLLGLVPQGLVVFFVFSRRPRPPRRRCQLPIPPGRLFLGGGAGRCPPPFWPRTIVGHAY
jgi:hypothetical protein